MEYDCYCISIACQCGNLDELPPICDDFKFRVLLQAYKKDLKFNSEYLIGNFKLDGEKAGLLYDITRKYNEEKELEIKFDEIESDDFSKFASEQGLLRKVTKKEVEEHKTFLISKSEEWKGIVLSQNQKNQKLKDVSEESRQILRELKKQFKRNQISLEEEEYQLRVFYWKAKYMYLEALSISEYIASVSAFPCEYILKDKLILFTFKSLFHILYKHFAWYISPEPFKVKSYHSPIFKPNNIHSELKSFFEKINNSEMLSGELITSNVPLHFNLKGEDYEMYFKSIKNKPNHLFISSLYPINNSNTLQKLRKSLLLPIDNDLSIYRRIIT